MIRESVSRCMGGCPPGGLGNAPIMVRSAGAARAGLRRALGGGSTLGAPVNWEALFWEGIVDPEVQFPLDPADAAVVLDEDPPWWVIDWAAVGNWVNDFAAGIGDPIQSYFAYKTAQEQRQILDQRRRNAGEQRGSQMAVLLPAIAIGGGVLAVFAFKRK